MSPRTRPDGRPLKQVHLAAHFPGVNNTTIWSDERSRSQIDFSSFRHFAQNAERGTFDFLFLAEGLRVREQKGRIHELDVAGRPNTLAVLAALAGVTANIGLVGTLSATFNEPFELARQLATLDHLSDGRAGWNIVTTSDAFHGANFRRGAFLDYAQRYERAEEFLDLARRFWDGWQSDALLADRDSGRFVNPTAVHPVEHHGAHFDVSGFGTLPPSPQRHPVIVQAGNSPDGRGFAARSAEVIFSLNSEFEAGQAFSRDVGERLAAVGRRRDSLLILPAATFVLGDTEAEARERAREVALLQTSPQTAIAFIEQLWGTDLTGYDPDGPLPSFDPEPVDTGLSKGRVRHTTDPVAVAREWRALSEAEGLSLRDVAIRASSRQSFVGTPEQVADAIDRHVQEDAADGFVIVGETNPTGLDAFVDQVIPLLRERGVYREEYTPGATLRETLGLPELGSAGSSTAGRVAAGTR